MAILTLSSNNPDLSWIIQKNPETTQSFGNPFSKSLRKGMVYGWFCDPGVNQTFRLLFVDHPTESSFSYGSRENFEYLDKSRYGHPYCAVQMIDEALRSASKPTNTEATKDTSFSPGSVVTYDVCTHASGVLHLMAKITETREEKFSYEEVGAGVYSLRCESPTVIGAINTLLTVCLVLTIKDKNFYLSLKEAGVTKVLNVMERANSPYFIRHLFLTVGVNNREMFLLLKQKGLLGKPEEMDLQFGNTQQQRHDFIRKALKDEEQKDRLFFDVGCGEQYHISRLASYYLHSTGFDKDPELKEPNERGIRKKELGDKMAFEVVEVNSEWVGSEGVAERLAGSDILISEVLEHMPKEEAFRLLADLTDQDDPPNKIVLTVPNRDFNKHFPMDDSDDVRHYDHKWEPNPQEWEEFVKTATANGMDIQLGAGGDRVGTDHLFLTAILTKKDI